MDICLTPSMYMPGIDNHGNYVDCKPSIIAGIGITCPCRARANKTYESSSKFASHIKTQTHVNWLEHLNNNKSNYYLEAIREKELNKTQQQIISKLENELYNKSNTITYLTKQLTYSQSNSQVTDLLDIND